MKLPDLRDFDLSGKKVLVRVDFDVPLVRKTEDRRQKTDSGRQRTEDGNEEMVVGDQTRIENNLPTIKYLLSVGAKIILLSHLGRPEGKVISELSLVPVDRVLSSLLGVEVPLVSVIKQLGSKVIKLVLLENLRFDPGEEANNEHFIKELANLGDFFVNDAFAVCHREHASIVGLPKLLPHAAGLELLREVKVLSDVLENPKRPVVVILGGVKEDKLEVVPGLLKFADYILIGGRLPVLIQHTQKILIGELNESGKDITLETIEKFGEIIERAGTIIWAGPMGEYEESDWELGTKELGRLVVESGAFTVIGGGDTEAALTKFKVVEKIDFVSSGGGAMLEFLARGDLPGLAALREL